MVRAQLPPYTLATQLTSPRIALINMPPNPVRDVAAGLRPVPANGVSVAYQRAVTTPFGQELAATLFALPRRFTGVSASRPLSPRSSVRFRLHKPSRPTSGRADRPPALAQFHPAFHAQFSRAFSVVPLALILPAGFAARITRFLASAIVPLVSRVSSARRMSTLRHVGTP